MNVIRPDLSNVNGNDIETVAVYAVFHIKVCYNEATVHKVQIRL